MSEFDDPLSSAAHRARAESTARDATAFAGPGGARAGSVADPGGLYHLLVESVADYAIFALSVDGIVLSWNAGAQRFKGYTAAEIIGRHFSLFYPPEDVAAGKPAAGLRTAVQVGRAEDEGWRVRKDGTLFWASVVITALREPDGRLVGFAKVTRDLTERRRAEEALRMSEQRFRLLVNSVRDYGIFMLDLDGRIASWNEGARRINGYEAEEIIGRHFSLFYPAASVAAGHPENELSVATRVGRFEEEGWRVRKDGTEFWANVVLSALHDESGTLIGFAKVTRDLTERRIAQLREVEDARRLAEVEASNRAKSGFLAAMSHELRTPLNAIGGYAQLMEEGIGGSLSAQQREYLSRIQLGQQHLLGIVNDLLNFARIDAGSLSYDLAEVTLREVVDEVLSMMEPMVARRKLHLAHGPCPGDVVARVDRLKAEQIVVNLLSNAVKFTPQGGTITVGCSAVGDRVRISVRDTGPGIPEDKLESIFEPFVQLGRSLTSVQEGTGLGLAISRELARAMQGDILVESRPGEGATFVFEMPSA